MSTVRDPYRDSLPGLRARVEELHREATARERRLTPELFRFLPAELAAELREAPPSAPTGGADFETLSRLEQAFGVRLAAIERAIALAPELEAACRVAPEEVRDAQLPKASLLQAAFAADVSGSWERTASAATAMVKRLDGKALVASPAFGQLRLEFRTAGAPFVLWLEFRTQIDESTAVVQNSLTTSVAPAAPRLRLSPELMRHWLMKSFGLLDEIEVNAPHFDGLFLIETDQAEAARRLLSKPVLQALQRLARLDIPTLLVGEGSARLRWTYPPDRTALAAAVQALALIRSAPVNVRLLRDDAQ